MGKIKGRYEKDSSFTRVFCDGKIYVLPHNSTNWGCVSIGERMADNNILTQEIYDKWASECKEEGTFEF